MKQKRIVSMIGALVVILSAVALITGCPQANGNKNKKENTTTNNGGNISQGLEGGVFRFPVSGKPGQEIYYYFSNGIVYYVGKTPTGWVKYKIGVTYQGNTVFYPDKKTGQMESETIIVSSQGITLDGQLYQRVTDQGIINTIKNLPVSSMPSNG